jgi:hypothetical protein
MEQKKQITNVEELVDWITTAHHCFSVDIEDNGLYVQAPNSSDVFVSIAENDEINDILSRTIERFDDFDADEQFMELWNADFAKDNGFTPSQFIKMLQEDEASLRELADKLREMQY